MHLVADGFCNDEANTPDCYYDAGDCCLGNVNKDRCSECNCYLEQFCSTGFHTLLGDGFCNDEVNTQECQFDGGDCCVNINKDKCSDCQCHDYGSIISPRYPLPYPSNLYLTWHIHFSFGKRIKIEFLEFDVETIIDWMSW